MISVRPGALARGLRARFCAQESVSGPPSTRALRTHYSPPRFRWSMRTRLGYLWPSASSSSKAWTTRLSSRKEWAYVEAVTKVPEWPSLLATSGNGTP